MLGKIKNNCAIKSFFYLNKDSMLANEFNTFLEKIYNYNEEY